MNPYRNSSGTRYLKGLFFEVSLDKETVLYTLKESDHEGFPSLQRLYLECNDPTEYLVATTYFDGVEHWEMICQCNWFQPFLKRMRRELELKIKSEQIRLLMADAQANTKTSTASAKYILDKGYQSIVPDKRKAGRPTKDEIAKAAIQDADFKNTVNEDLKRIKLVARPSSME